MEERDIKAQIRRDLLKEPKPKTWVGKALKGGEWTLGGLSDAVSRNIYIPIAKSLTEEDPVAQYNLEKLRNQWEHPIFPGDVASAAGTVLTPEEGEPGYIGFGKGVGRFALDVAGDPLTYVPLGALTKLGRATKLLKAAAMEGRTIEEGSKVHKLVGEVLGKNFLEIHPDLVNAVIERSKAELEALTPRRLQSIIKRERELYLATAKSQALGWFYWTPKAEAKTLKGLETVEEEVRMMPRVEGATLDFPHTTRTLVREKGPTKIFVGSERHKRLIAELGENPVETGKVLVRWTVSNKLPGQNLSIPFHFPQEAREELAGLLEKAEMLKKADKTNTVESVTRELGPRVWGIGEDYTKALEEAMNSGMTKEEALMSAEVQGKLKNYQDAAEELRQRLIGLPKESAGPSVEYAAAHNAYLTKKIELLKKYPLHPRQLILKIHEEANKIPAILKAAGREDLLRPTVGEVPKGPLAEISPWGRIVYEKERRLTGQWAKDIMTLREAKIPELDQLLDNIRIYSSMLDKTKVREALIDASASL